MSVILAGVELPRDIEWLDEFEWSAVTQQREITTGGTLLCEESAQVTGRPITLATGNSGSTWFAVVNRTTVLALQALADVARGQSDPMLLVLEDDREFDVLFRHDERAVEARTLYWMAPPEGDDLYSITLRLITVS